jgi:hypothetical protein
MKLSLQKLHTMMLNHIFRMDNDSFLGVVSILEHPRFGEVIHAESEEYLYYITEVVTVDPDGTVHAIHISDNGTKYDCTIEFFDKMTLKDFNVEL